MKVETMKIILSTIALTFLLALVSSINVTDLDQVVRDKVLEGALKFSNVTLEQYLSVSLDCNNSVTTTLRGCASCPAKRQLLLNGNVLADVIETLFAPIDIIQSLVNSIVNAIPNLVNTIVTALEAVLRAVLQLVEGILALLLQIVQGLINSGLGSLQEWAENILNAVEDIAGVLSNILTLINNKVSSVVMGLLMSLQNLGNDILDIVGNLLTIVGNILGGILGGLGRKRRIVFNTNHNVQSARGFIAIKAKRAVDCILCSSLSAMNPGEIINEVCDLDLTDYLDTVKTIARKVKNIVKFIKKGNTVVQSVSGTIVTYNLAKTVGATVDAMTDLDALSLNEAGDVVASKILAAEGLA